MHDTFGGKLLTGEYMAKSLCPFLGAEDLSSSPSVSVTPPVFAASGYQGVLVPSVQARGANLVLWSWNEDGAAKVVAVDPLGDLPRDQSSLTSSMPGAQAGVS